jgi:hypothetical protein
VAKHLSQLPIWSLTIQLAETILVQAAECVFGLHACHQGQRGQRHPVGGGAVPALDAQVYQRDQAGQRQQDDLGVDRDPAVVVNH